MESLDPGNGLVEGLALSGGNLKLKGGRLAGTVGTLETRWSARDTYRGGCVMLTYSEGTSTPGATTVNLVQVAQLGEDGLVAQGNVDEAVVSESAHRGKSSGLLTTTLGTGGDEETGVLAPVATRAPDATGLVPEGLPLSREVTVTGRDTEQNSVEGEEIGGLSNGVASLSRSVHLSQNFVAEGLGDPRDINVNQMISRVTIVV